MSAAFTRGPWVAKRAADGCGDIGIVADNGCVAECYHTIRVHDEKAHEECLANAHLIAAAPELYALLDECLEKLPLHEKTLFGTSGLINRIGEELKKARGET